MAAAMDVYEQHIGNEPLPALHSIQPIFDSVKKFIKTGEATPFRYIQDALTKASDIHHRRQGRSTSCVVSRTVLSVMRRRRSKFKHHHLTWLLRTTKIQVSLYLSLYRKRRLSSLGSIR